MNSPASKPRVTALIADDEAPMRAQLRTRLQESWPALEIVAEAENGMQAVALAKQHQPDIVFLDIRMPGMSGIDAARQLFNRCHLVFVTAYDQYAIAAFEQGALDYLLKPVGGERLRTTCARLQARIGQRHYAPAGCLAGAAQRRAETRLSALDTGSGRPESTHDQHPRNPLFSGR